MKVGFKGVYIARTCFPDEIRKLTLWLAGIDHLSMVIYQYRTMEMTY